MTCDNWFTTSTLAEKLSHRRTTVVGTLRKNRRDIPPCARSTRGRRRKSALYYSSGDQVLVSYYDKTSPILLLSSMHQSGENDENGKPEIVQFYNHTKSGTDNMDHLVRLYRSGRKCRRWPYAFVFNMVDIALVNSCVIFRSLHAESSERNSYHQNTFRYNFLLNVSYQLMDRHIRSKLDVGGISMKTRNAISMLGYDSRVSSGLGRSSQERKRSGRCRECPRQKDGKTTQKCSGCNSFVCNEHSKKNVLCRHCV